MQNNRKLYGLFTFILFVLVIAWISSYGTGGYRFADLRSKILDTIGSRNNQSSTLTQSVVEEESSIINVVDKVSPAVVSVVEKTVDFDPFSGPSSSESGIGTGFIVDSKGVILTNSHVVSDPQGQYSVVLKSGKSYDVKKIHSDPLNDVAILEISATGLPTVGFGDSSKLKVGQKAIAIGNALGKFSNTVTVGVVSGLARQVTASGPFGEGDKTYNDVIQTDAALNPGNSGGPLLNLQGQVIGINVATTIGASNIGFAIPINHVKPILDSFRTNGRIIRPFLGVNFVMITGDVARLRNYPVGAFVRTVQADSPADKAGVQRGDVVTKINSKAIDDTNPLNVDIQQNHKVGDTITLTVDRNHEILTLKATLVEAPQ